MTFTIIGNIISLMACLVMVYSGFVKTKKKILFYQTLEVGLAGISYIFLGGVSGVIISVLDIIRNILCYKNKLNVVAKIIIAVLSIILVVYFNNYGWIGLLPLVGILIYLWFMTIKDVVKFKIMIMVLMALWAIYDFTVKSYVACAFDILTIFANIISIISIKTKSRR